MWGKATLVSISGKEVMLQIQEHHRHRWKKLAKEQPVGQPFTLELHLPMSFHFTDSPGIVSFLTEETPDIYVQRRDFHATRAQQTTLWGICYFIAWCQEGHKPSKETQYWIREGIIEEASPWVPATPGSERLEPMRPSDPRMTTKEMAKIIQHAVGILATQDVPAQIEDAIGKDMHHLWKEWYEWRYSQTKDPLGNYAATTWEEFKKEHPVCMACGQPESYNDPLERQHIVSVGADKTIEEAPWNWLRTHRSHHTYQHGRGWEPFLEAFPHLRPLVERAHEKAAAMKQGELF